MDFRCLRIPLRDNSVTGYENPKSDACRISGFRTLLLKWTCDAAVSGLRSESGTRSESPLSTRHDCGLYPNGLRGIARTEYAHKRCGTPAAA